MSEHVFGKPGQPRSAPELLTRAVEAWGQEAQLRMLQEECAECIVAVNKLDRRPGAVSLDALASEVADVLIMAEQARLILGPDRVDGWVDAKLARLSERLSTTGRPA